MNFILKITKIIILISISLNAFSDEIQIDSTNMDIVNNGNSILENNAEVRIPAERMKILSKKANYEKITDILTFQEDVILIDEKNEIIII